MTVKMVVASAINEQGEEIHPRKWNHEFIAGGLRLGEALGIDLKNISTDCVTLRTGLT
jgi:hypothetical protein